MDTVYRLTKSVGQGERLLGVQHADRVGRRIQHLEQAAGFESDIA